MVSNSGPLLIGSTCTANPTMLCWYSGRLFTVTDYEYCLDLNQKCNVSMFMSILHLQYSVLKTNLSQGHGLHVDPCHFVQVWIFAASRFNFQSGDDALTCERSCPDADRRKFHISQPDTHVTAALEPRAAAHVLFI